MAQFRFERKTCQKCHLNFHRGYYNSHKCTDEDEIYEPKIKRPKLKILTENNAQNQNPSPVVEDCQDEYNEVGNSTDECIDDEEEEVTIFSDSESDCSVDTAQQQAVSEKQRNTVTCYSILSFFLLKWQCLHKIPNAAVESLLKFLHLLLQIIFSVSMPITSYFKLQQSVGNNCTSFKKFVICKTCYKLYNYEDCIQSVEGKKESKRCKNILFPNHTQAARQKPCNTPLMQNFTTPTGKQKFRPMYEYCYRSLTDNLEQLLLRPETMEMCSRWRERKVFTDILQDVYDGLVWKDYQKLGFFQSERDLALLPNIDWFQPFERTSYSVGVIYLVLLNLPRTERYKKKNIMVVGVIPHLGKEPASVNSFIKPLIRELKEGYNKGLQLNTYHSATKQLFRVILLCTSSDLPATRKLCGFLSHSARLGCSKCLKEFTFDENGRQCCGGFDGPISKPRTNEQHRRDVAVTVKKGVTLKDKKNLESRLGVRHSEMLRLEYFDIVRHHVIDAMHNLMTGSSKKLNLYWIEERKLTSKHLEEMQSEIAQFVLPSKVGRMPFKIVSGMATFTAEEWKNWTAIFSLVLLKNKLPKKDYDLWKLYVSAFVLLCKRSISITELKKAEQLFVKFGSACEELYGPEFITPNMHLHCHLGDTVRDYGPTYTTWCYSVERMNGLMEKQTHNNKRIEDQIMKKLLLEIYTSGYNLNEDEYGEMRPLITVVNNLGAKYIVNEFVHEPILTDANENPASRFISIETTDWSLKNADLHEGSKGVMTNLKEHELQHMKLMYSHVYPLSVIEMDGHVESYKRLRYGQNSYGCKLTGSHASSHVMAYWRGCTCSELSSTQLQPGQIVAIYKHSVQINKICKVHMIAKVEWYSDLPGEIRNKFGCPVQVYSEFFMDPGLANFIPIARLKCQCACLFRRMDGRRVVIVSPIIQTMQ